MKKQKTKLNQIVKKSFSNKEMKSIIGGELKPITPNVMLILD